MDYTPKLVPGLTFGVLLLPSMTAAPAAAPELSEYVLAGLGFLQGHFAGDPAVSA